MRAAAPRSLNEPVRCRFSSFSQTSAPVRRPSAGAGTSGVTRVSRRTRSATSPPVTSRQISGSNSALHRLRNLSRPHRTHVRQAGGRRNAIGCECTIEVVDRTRSCQAVGQAHAEEADAPRVEHLWDEIRRLKRDKRAFIPAHNYQVPEVQAIADTVGDSFELAVRARDIDATAGRVLRRALHGRGVPHAGARSGRSICPTCRRSARWPRSTPTTSPSGRSSCARPGARFATMTYVNTYADVKALSDTCCTSSNAARIAGKLGVPDILFVPDQNLAYQVALKTRRMYLPPPEPHKFHPREYARDGRAAHPRGRAAGAGRQRLRLGGRLPRPPPDDRRRHRAHPAATIRRRP